MKKILAFVLMAAILACPVLASGEPAAAVDSTAVAVAAAATASAQESHNFSYEVTKEATCVEGGILTYTCVDCGLTFTVPTQPTGQHSYVRTEVAATCTTDGYVTETCSVCGDSHTEVIAATGHVPSAAAATCTESVICTVCGEVLQPATGHAYTYQYDAVQNEDGTFASFGTWVCDNCGDQLAATEGNAVYYYGQQEQGSASGEASAEEAEEAAAPNNPNYDPSAINWATIEVVMAIVIIVVFAVLMLSFGKGTPAKKKED